MLVCVCACVLVCVCIIITIHYLIKSERSMNGVSSSVHAHMDGGHYKSTE